MEASRLRLPPPRPGVRGRVVGNTHTWTECSVTQSHLVNQRCFGLSDWANEEGVTRPFRWVNGDEVTECGKSMRKDPDARFITFFTNVDENDGLPNKPDPNGNVRSIKQNCMKQKQCICTDDGYNRLANGVATVKIMAKWASDCRILPVSANALTATIAAAALAAAAVTAALAATLAAAALAAAAITAALAATLATTALAAAALAAALAATLAATALAAAALAAAYLHYGREGCPLSRQHEHQQQRPPVPSVDEPNAAHARSHSDQSGLPELRIGQPQLLSQPGRRPRALVLHDGSFEAL
eukprot:scaffold17569_cov55-Phaeocystis_antarctica.AAC.1